MKRSSLWILAAMLCAGTAHAQTDQSQLIRPAAAEDLNTHLARLATNPKDITALIGAGEAALALDDPRAAAGFFARADAVNPRSGRVKAGLARVMLQLQNPVEAVRLFDLAAQLGYADPSILSDRGMAHDMVGDQAAAQRDYLAALQKLPGDAEITRRYAASLGISGQVEAADRVLQPLLYKSDRAAWRYRAFILAMNNRQGDAKKIADQTMPAQLAAAIIPYMKKMPYLTAAQKAAAVHFGHFPVTVGTSIAAVTPTPPATVPARAARQSASAATAAEVVQSTPATTRRSRQPARTRQPARSRTRTPALAQATTPTAQPTPSPAPAPATVQPTPQPQAQTRTETRTQTVQPTPTPAPAPAAQATQTATPPAQVQGPPSPGLEAVDSAPATATPAASTLAQTSASTPAPATAQQQPDPEATRSLSDIIHAIDVPEAERRPSAAAVDLAEIAKLHEAQRIEQEETAAAQAAEKAKKVAAAKAKAQADAKAKKIAEEKAKLKANPARSWLQVGVGSDKGALAFTMKRLRAKYDSLAPQDAWTADWGRTSRLLVGPFPSFTRARALEQKMKAAGADVFAWRSEAGEVVEKLNGG